MHLIGRQLRYLLIILLLLIFKYHLFCAPHSTSLFQCLLSCWYRRIQVTIPSLLLYLKKTFCRFDGWLYKLDNTFCIEHLARFLLFTGLLPTCKIEKSIEAQRGRRKDTFVNLQLRKNGVSIVRYKSNARGKLKKKREAFMIQLFTDENITK